MSEQIQSGSFQRKSAFARGFAQHAHRPELIQQKEFAVQVVFTTWAGTHAALMAAGDWARQLEGKVVLRFLEVVPRQFALRRPPASIELATRRLSALATAACSDVNVEIQLCLCTDLRECLAASLEEKSLVILGGRSRWWRTWEKELAEFLRERGHVVLFVDIRGSQTKLMVPGELSHTKI